MKNNSTYILVLAVIAVFSFGLFFHQGEKQGSNVRGNDYNSTTTDATWSGVPNRTLIVGPATFGSVIITGATAGAAFTIWDATSTTDISSTTIATFTTGAVSGTYTFDVNVKRGISVNAGSSVASTITWAF